jgi:serine/threonine protein kinase
VAFPQPVSEYLTTEIGFSGGREIGRGGSSVVKLVRDPRTGSDIVVKYFSSPNLAEATFIREAEFLSHLNHPCVLRIIGWAFPRASALAEIHTDFAENGSLSDVLKHVGTRSMTDIWTRTRFGIIICDIVLGMRYVHLRGIIHRDLKPSNILITNQRRALIADFGASRFEPDDATLTPQSGTIHYSAPELCEEFGVLTPKVDVYAFGPILYELLTGEAAFPSELLLFPFVRMLRSGYRPQIPSEYGEYMQRLIHRCWSSNPSDRPSFGEILGEFRDRRFDILVGANPTQIWEGVMQVVAWEKEARIPTFDHS